MANIEKGFPLWKDAASLLRWARWEPGKMLGVGVHTRAHAHTRTRAHAYLQDSLFVRGEVDHAVADD